MFRVAQTAVGGAINNSLVLSNHGEDDVRLMICNNDQSIKIFSVPSMNLITTLNYNSAVNNVGVSPDGTRMAVVGDSNQIHLHSISSSNEYKKMTTLTGKANSRYVIYSNFIELCSTNGCRFFSKLG